MTWDDAVASGLSLPGMEVSTSYGTPALKAGGKLVTRYLDEDDSIVLLGVPLDERETLLAADPTVFYVTSHYRDYPAVLAQLAHLKPERLWPFLVRRWRDVAPKRAVARFQAVRGAL